MWCIVIGEKQKGSEPVGRGRLTERLIAQGLLTPNMLQELRREWQQVQTKIVTGLLLMNQCQSFMGE
jgi:hypothetical protein